MSFSKTDPSVFSLLNILILVFKKTSFFIANIRLASFLILFSSGLHKRFEFNYEGSSVFPIPKICFTTDSQSPVEHLSPI